MLERSVTLSWESDCELIVARYLAGESANALANEMGISAATLLYRRLEPAGVELRGRGEGPLAINLASLEAPASATDAWLRGFLQAGVSGSSDWFAI